MAVEIATTRFMKDDVNTYDESLIDIAKEINANFVLLSFTGTSGERETWNWKLIPEFIEKAHREDIQVSFYMKLTNINWGPMFHERPESKDWLMVYQDGTPALYGGAPNRYMGCLNNEGWLAFLREMVDKAVEYNPDALFYDNCFVPRALRGSQEEGAAEAWACYCDHCRARFRSYTKETLGWECALPTTPDWDDPVWQAFIKFRDKAVVDSLDMATRQAHKGNPDIIVYPNVAPPYQGGGGAKGSSTNQVAKVVDLVLFEKGDPPRPDSPPEGGLPRPVTSAIDWKYGAALKRGPIWFRLNNPAGWYSADRVRLGFAEASAFNGANHHSMASAQKVDKVKAKGIRRTYDFVENNEQYYTGVESVADVAVLMSEPTAHWYLPDRVSKGFDMPKNMQGIGQALAELHVPFDVVLDEDVLQGIDYRVLVTPNVACMSDGQVDAITRFVEGGGGLIATGVTSLYDDNYRTRGDYALADIFGAHHGGEPPDIVKGARGRGLSAYLPGSPDDDFYRSGLPGPLHAIREALAYTLRDDWQIQVDAPSTVVLNVTQKSGATIVHLINFETMRRAEGIEVTLRKPQGSSLDKVTMLSPDFDGTKKIEASEDTTSVSFTVQRLEIYDVVVVDWK